MAMNTLRNASVRDYNTELEQEEQATLENKAFNDITTEIQMTSCHLLELHQKRIQMYISQAKFQVALRDAETMYHIDPHSPLGYLCMGDIYRQQGRQQQAIDTFATGINTTSSNHPQYSSLIQAKEDATVQQEKRVDFITQLPFEIVMQHIIPTIIHHQPSTNSNQWPCLYVSTGWRDRILQSHSLHYETDEPSGIKVAKENQLDKFKDYVSWVTLYHFRTGDQHAQLFPWQSSKSLRRLNLHTSFTLRKTQTSRVLPVLMAVGDRLTHLTLTRYHNVMSTNTQQFSLEQILERTPHLQMLNITRVLVNEWNASKTYPNLIKLYIDDPPHTMAHDTVLHVLEHFPSLRAFSMFRCDQSQSLRVIQEYCPFLNVLRYAHTPNNYEDDYFDIDSYTIRCSTKSELIKLDLVVNYSMFNISDVISVLQQHHSTLQEISILVIAEDAPSSYERSMNISFPKLKSLDLTGNYDGSAHVYNWILKHAPNLTRLNLEAHSLVTPVNAIADPISEHITTLTMEITDLLDFQFLYRLVTHHINLGQRSCLKHLTLSLWIDTTHESCLDIGNLQQLDSLSISVWYSTVYSDAFSTMLDVFASRGHRLSSLSWKCHRDISANIWRQLQSMSHIKDLTLGCALTDSDILHALHCKPTRSLTMECRSPVSDHILDVVRERFSKMTLNLDFVE